MRSKRSSVAWAVGFAALLLILATPLGTLVPTRTSSVSSPAPTEIASPTPSAPSNGPPYNATQILSQDPPPIAPSPWGSDWLTYDPADGVVVDVVPTTYLGWGELLTWEYASDVWTNVTGNGPVPPIVSTDMGMAWDPSDQEVVLLGDNQTPLSNPGMGTWAFQAGVWRDISPAVEPDLVPFGTSTDTHDGGVLAFGISSDRSNATWLFKGGAWLKQPAKGLPSPTFSVGGWLPPPAVDDPASGDVLALGQFPWSFANGVWTNRSSWTTPPSLPWIDIYQDPATYDPALHAAVVYSDFFGNGGAWSVQNGTWTNIGGESQDNLLFPAIAYDARDGYLLGVGPSVLCQGLEKAPSCPQEGTWKLDATSVGSLPILTIRITPDNLALGEDLTVWANVTGGWGVEAVSFASETGDCLPPYNASEYVCRPTSAERGFILSEVIDQAGQAWMAQVPFNVTSSSPPSGLGITFVVEVAALPVVVALAVVVLLLRRRKARRRRPAMPPEPPTSATWA